MPTKKESRKSIAVLVYPGITLLDLVGTYSMLVGLTMQGKYKLVVVGERAEAMASDTPMQVLPDRSFEEVPHPGMLFVMGGPAGLEASRNRKILDYVRAASAPAELVGAVDTGSLILAAAGLLEGRRATTHWAYREELEKLGACYVREPWVEDGKFITAAGVSGGMDMGLHLLEKRAGQASARTVQTLAEYEPQPPFGVVDWKSAEGEELRYQRLFTDPRPQTGGKKQIAFVMYPGLTPLDIAGPLQVLSALSYFAPEFECVVVGERIEPMRVDNGLTLIPNKTFDEVPNPYALIVPGGEMPTLRAMSHEPIRRYVRTAAETAKLIGSVCTGALILAGLGLLEGRPATTHWAFYRILENLGSPYQRKRWVENGRIINSAGVSAGIDMALFFASRLTNEETARRVQLAIQYDPRSPLGKIEWNKLGPMLRMIRGFWSLAAPFIAAKPKRLLRQGQ